ncbi:hypothetical protein M0R45_014205 [Rubus argutus]|uniref:Protein kinase domain-containing protein n=1 Tax=Rubus argutus TaxID=59490 RepID=A0AAW1XKQ7_RUBAR
MPSIAKDEAPSIQWRKGDLIGSGAFGRVYMGMNTESGELIAVKEAHTKALQEEAKLLENLSHPKIVRYLGTEREDETITMLLEYVPGGSIQALLGKFGSFSIPVIKRFTKQLLLGLEYLHKKGIIHGDIKGANILVDNKGRIKLADFGVSKQAADSGARPTRGTPYWMAPEVIRGTGHDFSADIWSVGCTVIEMTTGNPPWNQQFETVAAFIYCVGTTKSHPPIPEHLSSSAKNFLHECLQKEPTMRPSASELLQHPFLTGKEVESQNLSHSAVMDVEMASFCQTYSEEIDSTWSDQAANSNFVSDPTCGGPRQLEGAIKQVFSKILKSFKRTKRIRINISMRRRFSYASIKVATCNFSKENKIGQGGFGTLFKGKLVAGQEVAVKRLSDNSCRGKLELGNELRLMHELQHRNLIHMLGFCSHDNEEEANTDRIVGTYGYMSPEYCMHGIFSMKSDVYSFGVLMLEIISGQRNSDAYACRSLVGDAWELWKKGVALELVDPKLDVSCINKDQLLRCIHVGLLCVEEKAADRPTMSDAISMLTNASVPLPKPTLPAFCTYRYLKTASTDGEGPESMSLSRMSINSMSISDFSGR